MKRIRQATYTECHEIQMFDFHIQINSRLQIYGKSSSEQNELVYFYGETEEILDKGTKSIFRQRNKKNKPHTIQKKLVPLREFARLNQEWAEKADYIEFQYTDEAEHQEDIQRLWWNRCKRLAK